MIHKIKLTIAFGLLCTVASYGQDAAVQTPLERLAQKCSQVVELNESINERQTTLNGLKSKLEELKRNWWQTCIDALNSAEGCDIDELINLTDSEVEAELLAQLEKIKNDRGGALTPYSTSAGSKPGEGKRSKPSANKDNKKSSTSARNKGKDKDKNKKNTPKPAGKPVDGTPKEAGAQPAGKPVDGNPKEADPKPVGNHRDADKGDQGKTGNSQTKNDSAPAPANNQPPKDDTSKKQQESDPKNSSERKSNTEEKESTKKSSENSDFEFQMKNTKLKTN